VPRFGFLVAAAAVVAALALSVVAVRLSLVNQPGTQPKTSPRRVARAPAPSTRIQSELIGKWKCEGEVITQDDDSQRHIPFTGRDEDLELLDNGQFVDGNEGITGEFAILDSSHVQFKVVSGSRLPKGLTYINEFSLSGDRLTLSISRKPPGVRRHDILYMRR
jgi:hypothetical protein